MRLVLFIITVSLLDSITADEDDESYLENFDHRILHEIQYPIATNGKYLYQNMLRYYSDLLDMFNMLKTGNVKVKRYVRDLVKKGGPKLFKSTLDSSKLSPVYNWTASEEDDFKSVFRDTKLLWNKIENSTLSLGENSESEDYSYSDSSEKDEYSWAKE